MMDWIKGFRTGKTAILLAALLGAAAFAQDLPRIAVYVTGYDAAGKNTAMGKQFLTALVESGRYRAVEQPGAFFNEAAGTGGAIDYERIRDAGKRHGAKFVCVADAAAGENKLSARIIDLESWKFVAFGEAKGPLEAFADASDAVRRVVAAMYGTPAPKPTVTIDVAPEPVTIMEIPPPEPEPTPAAAAQPAPDTGKPNIAVYVTGNVGEDEKQALGTHILAALVNSGRYNGIERSASFLAEIDKELVKQMSGDIDDSQISKIGKQFGVKFICIADITPAYGGFQVSARVINVETAQITLIGQAASPLITISDLTKVSDKVVRRMFNEPEPPEPVDFSSDRGFRMSAGGGGFLASDFGGGLQWANGERVSMPYNGGGMYLYVDAEYAEVFIGYSAGSGKWKSADVENQDNLPDMPRTYLNFGLFAKYPFSIMGRAKLFPLVGADYEISLSGSLKTNGGNVYAFDGADNRPNANALSALWAKFGAGMDYNLGHTLYLRAELLYGIRAKNRFEADRANAEKAIYRDDDDMKTVTGNGITFKAGVGAKF